jgi:DoxX-like family
MLFTWVGAALDVLLGSVVLVRRWRRRILQTQLAVTFAYTLIATFVLPALWADPFGSLLKNVTVLAATLALLAVED